MKKKERKQKLGFGRETVRTLTTPLTSEELGKVEGAGKPLSNTAACTEPGYQ